MFHKRKRIEDPALLETVRSIRCLACLKPPPSVVHHIKTVKSGGDDVAENCAPLCISCHSVWHQSGTVSMAEKYPVIKTWLELAGWVNEGRRWRR